MAKKWSKSESPIVGRWHIASMSMWDEGYINAEVRAYIEFDADGRGEFQFGYVRGDIGYDEDRRDGEPAVEFTWEGTDELDPVFGRGRAVLEGEELHGMIAFHQGDKSDFVATRATSGANQDD